MNLDMEKLQVISNCIILLGVVVAIAAIIYNVRTAKKSQTAAFLFESRMDKEYAESLHILRKAHKSGKSLRSYVFPVEGRAITPEEEIEKRRFQYILNFYERVAVSIREGIYHESMIKRISYTTVINTWDIAEPLIKAVREKIKSQTIYQEYEWLVNRWKKIPLKTKK